MPNFYFDIHEGARSVPDADGEEFDGLEAAGHHGVRLAAERARTLSPEAASRIILVDIRNEHKQRVMTVTVFAAAERVALLPPDVEGFFPNPWIA
jgi:hypothetical protein